MFIFVPTVIENTIVKSAGFRVVIKLNGLCVVVPLVYLRLFQLWQRLNTFVYARPFTCTFPNHTRFNIIPVRNNMYDVTFDPDVYGRPSPQVAVVVVVRVCLVSHCRCCCMFICAYMLSRIPRTVLVLC